MPTLGDLSASPRGVFAPGGDVLSFLTRGIVQISRRVVERLSREVAIRRRETKPRPLARSCLSAQR